MKNSFHNLVVSLITFCAILLSSSAFSQWNTNTSVNLQIAGLTVGDMQSVSTADGKLWVAYYHQNGGNYDMRAQLFDANGNKLLGADGVLVSNKTSGTATYVFNVCVDLNNNLIIGCQDERSGSMQAVLYKIDQAGAHVWNNNGVILGLGMVPYPAVLSNGETVVTWNDDLSITLKLQKISASGTFVWTNTISILVGSNPTTRGQIIANLNNKFTVVYQKSTGGISTNLYAQMFDNAGSEIYPPLQISNQVTAPYRYYSIAAEGDTTYFGYYCANGNRFNSFLQRINPSGTIPWGMNGSAFNTSTGASDNYQMTTNVTITPGSPYAWSVCSFCDPNQTSYGVYIQKYKKSNGARQFTDQGKNIYPISAQNMIPAGRLQLHGDTPMVLTYDKDYKIYVTRLDPLGNFIWPYNKTEISSTTASLGNAKGRFDFNSIGNNRFAGIWTENRGSADLGYIQGISKGGLFAIDVATQGSVPATITTGNGTLQLTATVFPSYANQLANWSIIPITGDATINSTGLITAISDGTAWAKGSAIQDETVSDSILITISGQIPILADVITLPADNVGWFASSLNGSVDANYYNSTVSFEWGLTTGYGNTINATPALVTGGSAVEVTATLNGLTHSTTYHYRCKAINLAGTSYGQDLTFTTDCQLSGNIGIISGTATVCSSTNGITYSIPAFAEATGYEWTVPQGVDIVSGNNTNTIAVDYSALAISGNILVKATNGICYSNTTEPFAVIVNYPPVSPGNINGISVVCEGDQGIGYSVNPIMEATSYDWTLPTGANIVSGTNTNSIQVNFNAGAISGNLSVYASNNCGEGSPSNPLFINIEPIPSTPLPITGPEQLCTSNDEITFSVPAVSNAYGYVWTVPSSAVILSGANTNVLKVKFPNACNGTISVYAINGNCHGLPSPNKQIDVYPIPPAPVVTAHYDTLISSSAEGNQWYFQGQLIPGATEKTHFAIMIGNYSVIVTLNNCSSEVSNSVFMSPVGIKETETLQIFDIYPNPNQGNFTILLLSEKDKQSTLKLFSLSGKEVMEINMENQIQENEIKVSCMNISSGMYWLVLQNKLQMTVRKVIIQ